MKTPRKPGFYWVSPRPLTDNRPTWTISQWAGEDWYFSGTEKAYSDASMLKIDERRIESTAQVAPALELVR